MNKWKKLWDIHPGDESPDFPGWIIQVKALGDKLEQENKELKEELETRTSLETIERIGESQAHKKLESIRKMVDDPLYPDLLKVMRIKEMLGPSVKSDTLRTKEK